jgi:hypothetical protein
MSNVVTNNTGNSHIVILDASKAENSGIFGSTNGKGHRIFANSVNSLLGHSIFEELRNDHIAIHTGETPHKFFGTLNNKEQLPVPSTSIKILNSKTKPRTFKKQIASCDIFILDLMNSSDFEEVEYIIKMLKSPEFQQDEKERTLVIVSSVMTWLNTPKKLKKNFPKPKVEDSDTEHTVNKKRPDESDSDGKAKHHVPDNEKVLYFTDAEYT